MRWWRRRVLRSVEVVVREPSGETSPIRLWAEDSASFCDPDGGEILRVEYDGDRVVLVPLSPWMMTSPAKLKRWADHIEREAKT